MITGWLSRRAAPRDEGGRHGWRYAAVAGLAGCIVMAGCGPARPAAAPAAALAAVAPHRVTGTAAYLGAVPGTGALIAITVQGTGARGYLCDGVPGRAVRLADWFTGPVRRATLEAVSSQHHIRLAARPGPRAAAGQGHGSEAARMRKPGKSGCRT
jgi:hypothetical protein